MNLSYPPWRGELDGRFEFIGRAAKGTFSEVFKAKDKRDQNTVAIKVLLNEEELQRFEREIELLKKISHSNVVRYAHHGKLPSGPQYVALEWLEGEDLQQLLDKGRISVEESVKIVSQAAKGLGELHRMGIIQRDIKPANIFVCKADDGVQAKIIDLGIARDRQNATITRAGALMGTPYYLSPELASADFRVKPASDVFGLSAVLYELVTRQKPFKAKQIWELVGKIIFEEPVSPRVYNAQISAKLEQLIMKGLSKEPLMRPVDGRSFARALDLVLPDVMATPQEMSEAQNSRKESAAAKQKTSGLLLMEIYSKPDVDCLEDEPLLREVKRIVTRAGGTLTTIPGNRLLGRFDKVEGQDKEEEMRRALDAGILILERYQGMASVAPGDFGAGRNPWNALNKAAQLLRRKPSKPGVWVDFMVARSMKNHFVVEDEKGRHLVTAKNK